MMARERYLAAWSWYVDHADQVLRWSEIASAPVLLACLPKGIYKPDGVDNPALSVKQTLASPYRDIEPVRIGETWLYQYHQESGGIGFWTNKALLASMTARWPVGVLRQVSVKPQTKYRVLGLAWVAEWRFDYFVLQGLTEAEARRFRNMSAVPQARSEAPVTDAVLDLSAPGDERIIRMAPHVIRVGQADFRAKLVDAYSNACAVSRYDALAALQAAHISGYAGPQSNVAENGLLLRADLHLLFDSGLMAVDGDRFRVRLHSALASTRYSAYHDQRLSLPTSRADWPSGSALEMHRQAAGL